MKKQNHDLKKRKLTLGKKTIMKLDARSQAAINGGATESCGSTCLECNTDIVSKTLGRDCMYSATCRATTCVP